MTLQYYLPSIFLIDNDEDDSDFFETALKVVSPSSGLTIFSDCKSALHKINDMHFQIPDVIFLDLVLPAVDGFECITLLKENPVVHNVPVVVISGLKNPEHINRLWDMGVSYFISKPRTISELQNVIKQIVNTPSVFDLRTKNNFFVNRV